MMNKSFSFVFSIKLCLCDKVNFGLVKDSICCNEGSDLSKLIIKQTYIISLNTFSLIVLLFSSLFISRTSLDSFSKITGNTLVSIPRTDFWKAKCR